MRQQRGPGEPVVRVLGVICPVHSTRPCVISHQFGSYFGVSPKCRCPTSPSRGEADPAASVQCRRDVGVENGAEVVDVARAGKAKVFCKERRPQAFDDPPAASESHHDRLALSPTNTNVPEAVALTVPATEHLAAPAPGGVDICLYGDTISPWHEQRRQQM